MQDIFSEEGDENLEHIVPMVPEEDEDLQDSENGSPVGFIESVDPEDESGWIDNP